MLNAFLQAVGALASIVGGYSSYSAFLSLFFAESPDEIGLAVDLGLAISFLPALIASVYVYLALSGSLG
ncbi:MAG TPA: hypothetical protein VIM28_04295 [Solirubrobacterales bacterium]